MVLLGRLGVRIRHTRFLISLGESLIPALFRCVKKGWSLIWVLKILVKRIKMLVCFQIKFTWCHLMWWPLGIQAVVSYHEIPDGIIIIVLNGLIISLLYIQLFQVWEKIFFYYLLQFLINTQMPYYRRNVYSWIVYFWNSPLKRCPRPARSHFFSHLFCSTSQLVLDLNWPHSWTPNFDFQHCFYLVFVAFFLQFSYKMNINSNIFECVYVA